MNLGERSSAYHPKDKTSNDAASKTFREEMLSPTRRSSRIKKIKQPYDNYSLEKGTASTEIKELPLELEKSENPSTSTKVNRLSEKNCQFFEDSDDEESFESMFDDIFEQNYSKTLQSLLPKKLADKSVTERKFFKRNSLEPSRVVLPNYANESNLPGEDVTKVFKIISKSTALCDLPTDTKTVKSSLKTYSNKRKSDKNNVVESFALPDYPIVPEIPLKPLKPMLNDKLDADILDASEITIVDVQYNSSEPWMITNVIGEKCPFYEDVRIKADPTEHDLFKNSNFLDVKETEECGICNEVACSLMAPKNSTTTDTSKEIDIEAIKINFKKMLSSPNKDAKGNFSPKKKNAIRQFGSEISFVETDSLTEDETEFEFSNTLPTRGKSMRSRSNIPVSSGSKNKQKNSSTVQSSAAQSEKSIQHNEMQVKNTRRVAGNTESLLSNSRTSSIWKPDRSKRVLRSSLDCGKKSSYSANAEKNTATDVKEKTNNGKSKVLDTAGDKITNYALEKGIDVHNSFRETRRKLRSSSQERVLNDNKHAARESITKKPPSNEILTGVKITLENSNLRTTDRKKSNSSIDLTRTSSLPDIILEKCNMDVLQQNHLVNMTFPLRKDNKPLAEIMVVICPLDQRQVAEKLAANTKYSFKRDELVSPTRRKLRSTKMVELDKETGQSPSMSIIKCPFANNVSIEDNTKADNIIQRYRAPKKNIQGSSDRKVTRTGSDVENKTAVAAKLLDQRSSNVSKTKDSITVGYKVGNMDLSNHEVNYLFCNQDEVLKNDMKYIQIPNRLQLECKQMEHAQVKDEEIMESALPKTTDKKVNVVNGLGKILITTSSSDMSDTLFDHSNEKQHSLLVEDSGLYQHTVVDSTSAEIPTIAEMSLENSTNLLVETKEDTGDILKFPSAECEMICNHKDHRRKNTVLDCSNILPRKETDFPEDLILGVSTANEAFEVKSEENSSTKFIQKDNEVTSKKNEDKPALNKTSKFMKTDEEGIHNITNDLGKGHFFIVEPKQANEVPGVSEIVVSKVEEKQVERNRFKGGKSTRGICSGIFSPRLRNKAEAELEQEEISSDLEHSERKSHEAKDDGKNSKLEAKRNEYCVESNESLILHDNDRGMTNMVVENKEKVNKGELVQLIASEILEEEHNEKNGSNECKKSDITPIKTERKTIFCPKQQNSADDVVTVVNNKVGKKNNEDMTAFDKANKLPISDEKSISNRSNDLENGMCHQVKSNQENEVSNVEDKRVGRNQFKEGKSMRSLSSRKLFSPKLRNKAGAKLELEEISSDIDLSKESHKTEDTTTLAIDSGEKTKLEAPEIVDDIVKNKDEGGDGSNAPVTLQDIDRKCMTDRSNALVVENQKKTNLDQLNSLENVAERRRLRNRSKECKNTDVTSRKLKAENIFSEKLNHQNNEDVAVLETCIMESILSITNQDNCHPIVHDPVDHKMKEISDKFDRYETKDMIITLNKVSELTGTDDVSISNRSIDLHLEIEEKLLLQAESKQENLVPSVSENVGNVEENRIGRNRWNESKSTRCISPRKLFSPRLRNKAEAKLTLEEISSDLDHSKKKQHKTGDNSTLEIDSSIKTKLEAAKIVDYIVNTKNEGGIESNKYLTLQDIDRKCIANTSNALLVQNEKKPDLEIEIENKLLLQAKSKRENEIHVVSDVEENQKVKNRNKVCKSSPNTSPRKLFNSKLKKSETKLELEIISSELGKSLLEVDDGAKSNLKAKKLFNDIGNNKKEYSIESNHSPTLHNANRECITKRSNDSGVENEKNIDPDQLSGASSTPNVEKSCKWRDTSKEGKSINITTGKVEGESIFSSKLKQQKKKKLEAFEVEKLEEISDNNKTKMHTRDDSVDEQSVKYQSAKAIVEAEQATPEGFLREKDIDGISKHCTESFCLSEIASSRVINGLEECKSNLDMTPEKTEEVKIFSPSPRSKQKNNRAKSKKSETIDDEKEKSKTMEDESNTPVESRLHSEGSHLVAMEIVKVKGNENEDKLCTGKLALSTKKIADNGENGTDDEISASKNTETSLILANAEDTVAKILKKERIISPRLKQKGSKLKGNKQGVSDVEKSLKRPRKEAANAEITSTDADGVKNASLDPTIPVNDTERRATIKSEHSQTINSSEASSSNKRVSRRSAYSRNDSGDNLKSDRRMLRRQSTDDTTLLKRHEEYLGTLNRSKSVASRALRSKRLSDNDELANESFSYSSRLRSKSVAQPTIKTLDEEVDLTVTRISKHKCASDGARGIGACTLGRSKSFRHFGRSDAPVDDAKRNVEKRNKRLKEFHDKKVGAVEQEAPYLEDCKDFKDIKLENDVDFQIGDVAWGQIGCHPFWPCLVMEEPGTGYHKKIFQGKRFQRVLYHVRFFGDKGRRAWINKHQIMLYFTQNDLKTLQNKLKKESKVPLMQSYYCVNTKKLPKWQSAVAEAERVKATDPNKRMQLFFDLVTTQAAKRNEIVTEEIKSEKREPVLVKRKHKDVTDTDEKLEASSPSKKKFKKDTNDIEEKSDVAIVTQQSIDDSASQLNKGPPRLRLRTPMDEISEIDSKTSSDNTMDSSLDLMATQKALFKRNNLFRGISRDKVCQHCCNPGDVIKCRGPCNGVYHLQCATNILQEQIFKKQRRGRVPKSSPKQRSSDVDTSYVTKRIHSSTIKNDKFLDDEHVQIITVPSSVYNTPPRKTFPPNFRNMTLAEQIDYKMKEIMRKFESKTFYSESSIETNTEDDKGRLTPKQVPRSESPYASIDKVANNIETVAKPENQSLIRQFQQDVKQKLFMQHVTADSEALKSIKPETEEKQLNAEETTDVTSKVDPKTFKCGFCINNLDPFCFICCQSVSKKGNVIRQKCSLYQCGRFYHPECLKLWPQTQWSLIQTTKHRDSDKVVDSFVCPLHVCHTCASDDPRAATSRCSGDKIVKCLHCPSTYHSTNLCVPAGSTLLSSTQIICPRHREKSKQCTINTTWCFLCSQGGNLICCETCPTSVHPECLPVNLTEDDKFICEDCESGRLPLYDEIVWVKLGNYRWWPALILLPSEIPDNIMNIKHGTGEFVVKFFGTYDHYWVNRGRSFLFQDGDTGHCNSVKKKVDAAFNTAVEEAVVAHKLKKEFKLSQEAESITSLKPPPYIKIKVNRPVGNVRHLDLDLSSTNACECDPTQPHPCGPDSDCLNRLLLTECNAEVCPAGNRCKNQSFEKREYPPMVPYKTQGRGWGLKTLAPIKKGQFVIEYVGEMIDIEEYQRRIVKMHEQKEENYYFLTIDKDRMLDAGPKGNVARFMNHCCQPNCETQKWTVNGDTRVGLFATVDIPADTELTFNYNLECVGKEKKVCRCGAPNCSGFIGVKAKQDTDAKKPKKSYKKKVAAQPIILPPCFICHKKGDVVACNNKVCNKAYHLRCLKLVEWPEGNKFICPWHNCNICSKRTIRCCVKCVNSFCPSHSEGNVRYDNLLGFVCNTHDPTSASSSNLPIKLKKRRSNTVTDETAVTSTTSDDVDDEDDSMSLILRYRLQTGKDCRREKIASENESDFEVNESSTPLKKFKTAQAINTMPTVLRLKKNKANDKLDVDSENESEAECNQSYSTMSKNSICEFQEESAVSSATFTDFEEDDKSSKRKRQRPRRGRPKKRSKLGVQNKATANNSSLTDVDSLRSNSNSELDSRHNELENR